VRRILKRGFLGLIMLAAILWTADWLILRAKGDQGFDDIEVRHHFALQLKGKRIEQFSEKPEMEECVKSIFSHYDESPCWYLKRHAQTTEKVDSSPWHFWAQ
jgi:hypothetical protein